MRANLQATGHDASAAGVAGRWRCLGGALLCAAGLLWPACAAAAMPITITEATLLHQDNDGKVEEATLLFNPRAESREYELPQFRLKMKASYSSRVMMWTRTLVTFTSVVDAKKSATACTQQDTISWVKTGTDTATTESAEFNLFLNFPKSVRQSLFEALPAGDYRIKIQAFDGSGGSNAVQTCSTAYSDPFDVDGILTLKPFQELIAVTVNGAASARLQKDEKFDVHFTLKNNRRQELTPVSRPGTMPYSSAGIDKVEWLVASEPPKPTTANRAPGMTCANPSPPEAYRNFAGERSWYLLKTVSNAAAVPTNIPFGTYNLYFRVHDYISNACAGDFGISPVYELKDAIVVEPQVRSIRVTPSHPPPQPPLTVGKGDLDVVWEVTFTHAVTGVDAGDFRLVAPGIAAPGASIVGNVDGSGSTYRVTTKVPGGSVPPDQLASLRLDFVDDDSVKTTVEGRPVGGPGTGNGDFAGETRKLMGTICGAPNVIWCDDFERSTLGAAKANLVGNGWVATVEEECNSHTPSDSRQPDAGGCAGIDSDIRPYHDYAKPRANASRSMFNRWVKHAVTSEEIDLSGLPEGAAVELSYWLRRGDDTFAEKPDRSNDYFRVEYLDKSKKWQVLAAYRSTYQNGVAGEIFRPVFQLPSAALWEGFRLRFSQMGGWGAYYVVSGINGSDYWFVDDVVLRRVSAPRYAGGFCDNFEAPEASRKQWSFGHEYEGTEGETLHWGGAGENATASNMRVGDAGVTGDVYPVKGSETHSLFLRWSYVVASTLRIDTRDMTEGVPVSYVVQRGMKGFNLGTINGAPVLNDCGSTTANIDNDFVAEYYGSGGTWHELRESRVSGNNAGNICGDNFIYSEVLSDATARHADFRLRFRQVSKGGWQNGDYYYDYWLVDNVCVGRKANEFPKADLELTKTRMSELAPGGVVKYELGVKNLGPDDMRGDLQIVDTLPAGLTFHEYRGKGWFCEVAGQEATCNWSGELAVGASAPPLHIFAAVAETAGGTLKNRAKLSSGAVEDPNPGNNEAEDVSMVDSVYFHFTKGICRAGESIGGVDSPAGCSLYRFGGLADELKGDIYITHVNRMGTQAQKLSDSSETVMTLEFALRCLDPTGPPPQGAVAALFGASAAPSLRLAVCAGRDDASLPWGSALMVTIGKGAATVGGVYGFRYADVGRMELIVRVKGESADQGSSGAFVQKPARLALSDVVCADDTINPDTRAADGAAFCRAGQPFSLTVAALSKAGDGTPNFGRETARKGIFLEKVLLGPADGHNPDLALPGLGPDDFTGGRATITTASWPEVGIIELTPRLGDWREDGALVSSNDYLGAGDVPADGRVAVAVGRFYPDHFQTEIGVTGRMGCPDSLAPCPEGGFFYAGQPFALSVLACRHGDETCVGRLENYRDDFAGEVSLGAWGERGAESDAQSNPPDRGGRLSPVPDGALAGLTIPGAKFAGGLYTGRFRYVHADDTQPVRQTQVYFRAGELGRDGVSSRRADASDKSPEGGIAVARGRLRLSNQFGSEKTSGLEIPVQVQFWHCQGKLFCDWRASVTDTTQIAPVGGGGLAAGAVSLHPVEGVLPEVAGFELGGGVGRIVLKPKGVGSVNVSVNLGGDDSGDNACNHAPGGREGKAADVPWLRAWNGVCGQAKTGGADPFARASFGVYSGESRKSVHSREVY